MDTQTERPANVQRMLDNLAAAFESGRDSGVIDSTTGDWVEPVATFTVSQGNVPCEPGETFYILVSDLRPDYPIQFCRDHPVTEGPTPLELLLDYAAEVTDAGLLGTCQFCRDHVTKEDLALLLGQSGPPSKRTILHLECAQRAGGIMRDLLDAAEGV